MSAEQTKQKTNKEIDTNTLELFNRLVAIGAIQEMDTNFEKKKEEIEPPSMSVQQELQKRITHTDQVRRQIHQEALENMQYYTARSLATGKPWNHCPKKNMVYSEYIMLTPEMAEMLLRFNPRNRTIKQGTLASYCRDIENDRWVETDESIGIDTNGNLYNGQHRSRAVLNTQKPCIFYFTFNVLPEAKAVVDSGFRRTTSEKMQALLPGSDLKIPTKLTAVSRSMMRGLEHARIRWSDTELTRFATKYQDVIVWAVKHMPRCRADVQAVIAKAYLWYGEETMKPICHRFAQLDFIGDDEEFQDPMKTLYKWLQKSKDAGIRGIEVYKRTLSAVNAAVNNKSMKAISPRDEDIFEWDGKDDWEVPAKQ